MNERKEGKKERGSRRSIAGTRSDDSSGIGVTASELVPVPLFLCDKLFKCNPLA
jgi:hypothetical protein